MGKKLAKNQKHLLKSVTFEIPVDPNISYENRWLGFVFETPTGTCYAHVETYLGTSKKNGVAQ